MLLLCLYAAAAWHGTDAQHDDIGSAHCATTACASEETLPADSHGTLPEDNHAEDHGCALCTLLHAPAVPVVAIALPPVMLEALPSLAPQAAPFGAEILGPGPARGPPSLSA